MAAGQGPRACPPSARPTRCSATCRWSTRSSSTTPARAPRPSGAAHATVVDHLVPPMARADTYGDLAKLEQLLDEYATVQALDPAKVPAVRAQIWTLIQAAAAAPRPARRRAARTRTTSTTSCCTSTATCARSRTCRSATGCTSSATRRPARPGSTWCSPCCAPARSGAAPRRAARPARGARRARTAWTSRSCWPTPGAGRRCRRR